MRQLKELSFEDIALYREDTGKWVVVEGIGKHSETKEDLIVYQVVGSQSRLSMIEPATKFLASSSENNKMKQEFRFMHYLELNMTIDDAIEKCSKQSE